MPLFASFDDVKTFLAKDWEKYGQTDPKLDNSLMHENLSRFLGIENGFLQDFLTKNRLIALGQHFGFEGVLVEGRTIQTKLAKIPIDAFKSRTEEVIIDEGATKLLGWQPIDFLLYQIYFITGLIINLDKKIISLPTNLQKDVTHIKGLLELELYILINAYHLCKACADKTEANAVEPLMEKFIEHTISFQSEGYLACGSLDHAMYLVLTNIARDTFSMRIENASELEVTFFNFNCANTRELVQYLTKVTLALQSNQANAREIIYSPEKIMTSTGVRRLEHRDTGFPAVEVQTVRNCVVAGFRRGRYFRFYTINKNSDIYEWLLEQEKSFIAKRKEVANEFDKYSHSMSKLVADSTVAAGVTSASPLSFTPVAAASALSQQTSEVSNLGKAKINQTANVRGTVEGDVNSGAANIANIPVSRTTEVLAYARETLKDGVNSTTVVHEGSVVKGSLNAGVGNLIFADEAPKEKNKSKKGKKSKKEKILQADSSRFYSASATAAAASTSSATSPPPKEPAPTLHSR